MRDAEYILQCQFEEARNGLPWKSDEAMLVILGIFTVSRCFWYDFFDDRCFSVSSDDYLTSKEIVEHFDAVEAGGRRKWSLLGITKSSSWTKGQKRLSIEWMEPW